MGKNIFFLGRILFPLLLLQQTACTNQEKSKNSSRELIEISPNLDTSLVLDLSTVFSKADYIPLDNSSYPIPGEIQQIKRKGNQISIWQNYDTHLFLFNIAGEFLFELSIEGRGPGQIIKISDMNFHPSKDELWVWDDELRKMLIFDDHGTFLSEKTFPYYFSKFSFLNEKILALQTGNYNQAKEKDEVNLVLFSLADGKSIYKGIPQGDHAGYNFITSYPFSKTSNNSFTYVPYVSEIIFELDLNGLHEKYKINFGNKAIPMELIRQKRQPVSFIEEVERKGYVSFLTAIETKNYLAFRFFSLKENKTYQGFYNKNNLSLSEGSKFIQKKIPWDRYINYIKWNDNQLAYLIPAYKALVFYEKMNIEKLAEVKENDNPVLVITTLRD